MTRTHLSSAAAVAVSGPGRRRVRGWLVQLVGLGRLDDERLDGRRRGHGRHGQDLAGHRRRRRQRPHALPLREGHRAEEHVLGQLRGGLAALHRRPPSRRRPAGCPPPG